MMMEERTKRATRSALGELFHTLGGVNAVGAWVIRILRAQEGTEEGFVVLQMETRPT